MALKANIFQKVLLLVLWLASPGLLWAVTPPLPARPSQYVVDLAGVLDAGARARLNGMLQDLEDKTTAQVVVLTLNSLEGEPLEEFSHQTAVKWGLGRKGKDNGVLITVAVKDHKYRIEVGYGLEGVLPDSLVGSIGRQYLVPYFKKGDYAGGLVAAVTEITSQISEKSAAVTGDKPGKTAATKVPVTLILALIFIILLLAAMVSSRRRASKAGRRDDGGWFWFGGYGGGSSWGGGGFGGGGFSGGGGDFGGGGCSGDW